MIEEAGTRKRKPIGDYGKPLHEGTPVKYATKVICIVPQVSMATISDKDNSTTGDYAFPIL